MRKAPPPLPSTASIAPVILAMATLSGCLKSQASGRCFRAAEPTTSDELVASVTGPMIDDIRETRLATSPLVRLDASEVERFDDPLVRDRLLAIWEAAKEIEPSLRLPTPTVEAPQLTFINVPPTAWEEIKEAIEAVPDSTNTKHTVNVRYTQDSSGESIISLEVTVTTGVPDSNNDY